ncbi:MAG: hypothetical protein R3C03_03765 [Pirellulaceae bacterium]
MKSSIVKSFLAGAMLALPINATWGQEEDQVQIQEQAAIVVEASDEGGVQNMRSHELFHNRRREHGFRRIGPWHDGW